MSKKAIQDWVNKNTGNSVSPISNLNSNVIEWINKKPTSFTTTYQPSAGAINPAPKFLPMHRTEGLNMSLIEPAANRKRPTVSSNNINEAIKRLMLMQNPEYAMNGDNTPYVKALGTLLTIKDTADKGQKNFKDAYSKMPANLTPSEQQAKDLKTQKDTASATIASTMFDPNPYADYAGMVEAQQENAEASQKLDALTGGDSYIQQNMDTWIQLAAKPMLSDAEKAQAKDAAYVLMNRMNEMWKTEKDTDKYKQYDKLFSLLTTKYQAAGSAIAGGLTAIPGFNKAIESGDKKIASVKTSNPALDIVADNSSRLANWQSASPGAFTAGNIVGGLSVYSAGGELLGGLGIASSGVRNVILMGSMSAANSIANGDKLTDVFINTGVGALSGYVGGKAAESVMKSAWGYLSSKGLNETALKAITSGASGLSFGATQTAIEEAKTAGMALVKGEEYKPDFASIGVNLVVMTLFGALEAFKSDPKAAKIQDDLKANKSTATDEAVAYLNENATQIAGSETGRPAAVSEQGKAQAVTEPQAIKQEVQTQNDTPEGMGAMSNANPTYAEPSKFGTNTLTNTELLTSEQKARYDVANLTTERTTNIKDIQTASERLATDYNGEANALKTEGIKNSEEMHEAYALLFDAVAKDGATGTSAREWMELIAKTNTTAGQVVQANSIYSHTPQGKLVEGQKAIDTANENNTAGHKQAENASNDLSNQIVKKIYQYSDKIPVTSWSERTGELLSESVTRKNSGGTREKTFIQTMLADMKRYAQEYETAKGTTKRTAFDKLTDAVQNKSFIDDAWKQAQQRIMVEYKDNPKALAEYETFLTTTVIDALKAKLGKKLVSKDLDGIAKRIIEVINSGNMSETALKDVLYNYIYGGDKIKLTDADIQNIYDLMQKANKVEPGSYEANMYEQKANAIIASKLPKTFRNKLITVLMDNMLGNLRTLIARNAGGNVVFNTLETAVTHNVGAVVDAATSLVTGQRRIDFTGPSYLSEYGKGFAKGGKEAVLDFKNQVSTPRSGEELKIENQIKVFEHKAFNMVDSLVKSGLEIGDRPFYEAAYAARMQELTNLRNRNRLGKEFTAHFDTLAPTEAKMFALESVFQSKGLGAEGLTQLKKGIENLFQSVTGISLGGQFSVPFSRTPGGMLERISEYIPGLGLTKNAITTAKEIKGGKFNQSRFSMETGRNLTGIATTAGLLGLAANGVITGKGYGTEDEEIKKEEGWQAYSVKIGDKYYSYEWLPIIGPLAGAAADAYNAAEDKGSWGAGIGSGLQTVVDMSAMQGVNRMFGGYNGTVNNFINTMASGTSQFIPSLLRGVAVGTDPYQRETYNPNPVVQQYNKLASAVPLLRETLPQKVGLYGEPLKNDQGIIESMLSPSIVTQEKQNFVNDELLRLRDSGNNVPISYVEKTIDINGDGKKEQLSTKEYQKYQTTKGKTLYETLNNLFKSEAYKNLSDDQKAKAASQALEYANDKAKSELSQNRGVNYDSDWSKESEYKNLGTDIAFMTAYNNIVTDSTKDDKDDADDVENSESFKALQAVYKKLTAPQKAEVVDAVGTSTFEKVFQAMDGKIDPQTFFEWKTKLSEYSKKMTNSEANDAWRSDLRASGAFSSTQKNLLDSLIVNDGVYLPKDYAVDYSDSTTFTVSQMSDTAQKNYNEYLKGKVDADVFAKAYDFYNNTKGENKYGQTKQDKVFAYVNKLSLSDAQKDALCYALGYNQSSVAIAPW